ncbi:MAG: nucleotide 5'-monophosphate nucleosidase PpnN [Arenicella sp.]|nr:nucleotide 5'-monophosphate nucleosidase PpnN [Arenicella sp.]
MVNATITPKGQLDLLTRTELELLHSTGDDIYRTLFRNCALAVLSTGADSDEGHELLAAHEDFNIGLVSTCRGIKLKLRNAPENAFVDGKIIVGIRDHLFSVLRDIVYLRDQVKIWEAQGETITDMVFKTLRNADALKPRKRPNFVVCWGGHSINSVEYDYSKNVGYRLGLRGIDICTGCGIGAMKGPMKGANVAHAKQRSSSPRYIGISEPGIIASEAPNAIVNELIIMPDIEKRLEAFVRMAHGVVVFPGGAGTAEEILYILGLLLHADNDKVKLPVIFTGPKESAAYFDSMNNFISVTLGKKATDLYEVIIDDPIRVAQTMSKNMQVVEKNRKDLEDAFFFNWSLNIEPDFQEAFIPTHENMSKLNLKLDQPIQTLAANLRKAFSGIVSGNIKPKGIQAIAEKGPFELSGDAKVMAAMDSLLAEFVDQQRMKLKGSYTPCYTLVS